MNAAAIAEANRKAAIIIRAEADRRMIAKDPTAKDWDRMATAAETYYAKAVGTLHGGE